MSRPRALSKPDKQQSKLLTALQFISMAQSDVGAVFQTHCIAGQGWLKAFDGILTIAAPIEEDIQACPQTIVFKDAIAKAGTNFTIVQLEASKLAVRGPNGFRAFIPCLADAAASLPNVPPDPSIAPVNNALVAALGAVHGLISDKGERLLEKAILLRSGSALASDGKIAVEYWHGLDLPSIAIPKAAALALLRAGKEPIGFGLGRASATFHYADQSWIRTQLYVDPYPTEQLDGILNAHSNPWPLPAGFFEAVKAIENFGSGTIYFTGGMLRSHREGDEGATFELNGIPNNIAYRAKLLMLAEPFMHKVDFVGNNGIGYFFNSGKGEPGTIRGAICQVSM